MNSIGVYMDYEDAFNKKAISLEEIRYYFSSIDKSILIQALAKLNIVLWKNKDNIEFQREIAQIFFSDNDLSKVLRATKTEKLERFIFHRKQLLFAIKLVLTTPSVKNPLKEMDTKKLGVILLSINSYFTKVTPESYLNLHSLNANIALREYNKLYYFYHTGIFANDLGRALYFWTELPKTTEGQSIFNQLTFSPFDLFKKIANISIEEYIMLGFMNLIQIHALDPKTNNPEDFMIYPDFFSATKLNPNVVKNIYSAISFNLKNFDNINDLLIKEYLNGKEDFDNNFLVFVEKPIVELENGIKIVIDPTYLERRIFEGPYYLLLNYFYSIGEGEHRRGRELSTLWGNLIELYAKFSLEKIFDVVEKIPENNTDIRPDYLCIDTKDDPEIFIIETKKISPSLKFLWNGDRGTLIKTLKGDKVNFQHGFEQIYKVINLIQENKLPELNLSQSTLSLIVKASKIHPILLSDGYIPEHPTLRKAIEDEIFSNIIKVEGKYYLFHPIYISLEILDLLEELKKKFKTAAIFESINILYKNRADKLDMKVGDMLIGYFNLPVDAIPLWEHLYKNFTPLKPNKRLKEYFEKKMTEYKILLFGQG